MAMQVPLHVHWCHLSVFIQVAELFDTRLVAVCELLCMTAVVQLLLPVACCIGQCTNRVLLLLFALCRNFLWGHAEPGELPSK